MGLRSWAAIFHKCWSGHSFGHISQGGQLPPPLPSRAWGEGREGGEMPWQVSAAKLCEPSVYKFRFCLEGEWQRPHVIWRKSLFLKWNKNKVAVRVVAVVYLSHFRGITYTMSSLFPIESDQKNLCWQNKCILIPYHFWLLIFTFSNKYAHVISVTFLKFNFLQC